MISLIFLIGLIALILGPTLFSSGGVMLLDYVLSDIPALWFDRPIGSMISQLMWSIFGYALGSKLMILSVLALSGYLGILIARYFARQMRILEVWKVHFLEIIAMIFFMTNPFSYERMMTQPLIYLWVIALGYGLYFHIFREKYIAAGFSYAFALAIFPHASYMILFIMILFFVIFSKRTTKLRLLQLLLPIILLNLNWIVVTLIYNPMFTESISQFTMSNLEAFATQAIAPLDVFLTNLLLYGFWGEQFDNHFAHVSLMSPYWYMAGFAILLIVSFGAYVLTQMGKTREFLFLFFFAVLSLMLSVGSSSALTDAIREGLTKIFPYWDGYREPQKWTGMILIVEWLFLIAALAYIFKHVLKSTLTVWALTLVFALLLYIWSPGVYAGYRNQMRTSVVPADYFRAREVLRNEYDVKKVLLLPWHTYIGCGWISRPSVANPSVAFFREFPLVVSERIDVGSILEKNDFRLPESGNVEKFLENYDVELLKRSGISHIILMKYCYGSDEAIEYLDILAELGEVNPIYVNDTIDIYIIP